MRLHKNWGFVGIGFGILVFFALLCDRVPPGGKTLSYMTKAENAIQSIYEQSGKIPEDLDGLITFIKQKDPTVNTEVFSDEWGRRFQYHVSNQNKVELISLGRDGQIGGEGANKDIKYSFFLDEDEQDGKPK
jgi:hypothetical protein